jgi:hypothetical protein
LLGISSDFALSLPLLFIVSVAFFRYPLLLLFLVPFFFARFPPFLALPSWRAQLVEVVFVLKFLFLSKLAFRITPLKRSPILFVSSSPHSACFNNPPFSVSCFPEVWCFSLGSQV